MADQCEDAINPTIDFTSLYPNIIMLAMNENQEQPHNCNLLPSDQQSIRQTTNLRKKKTRHIRS